MKSPYEMGHLVAAAIRIMEYKSGRPPTAQDVCEFLDLAGEQGHLLCVKLQDVGVLEMSEGPYGTRLFVRDHLKLEDLPREVDRDGLKTAMEKFQQERKGFSKKIEAFKEKKALEQKALFAELDARLKRKGKPEP